MWPFLLSAAIVPAAPAAEQRLTYDLMVNGATVGSREVTIRYLDRPGGSRRLVESVTRVHFAGQDLQNRAVGQSGARSATFSSQTKLNGELGQYQGVYLPGSGWEVTLAGRGRVATQSWRAADGLLTTLDLVDPGRTSRLGNGGRATLFFVETGDSAVGTLGSATESAVTVGGRSIPVTEWALALDGGGMATFAVEDGGLLVRSEVTWLGVRVAAILHDPPPDRSFGTIEMDGFDTPIRDESL